MRLELCSFSGFKIHPGHGKKYVRMDDKVFTFINSKSAASLLMKRNARTTCWTAVYRKANRKGISEETAKKRTRKTKKFMRPVVGASLEVIRAKRNIKPEVREAARQQAIKEAKDASKAKQAARKAEKAKTQSGASARQAVKAPVAKQPKLAKPKPTSR